MNYYTARARIDGKWDFTYNGYPIGYCHEFRKIDPKVIHISESQAECMVKFAHKHHDCGHNTREEAQECYREYMLDQRLHLMAKMSDSQHRCQVCSEWTQLFAEIGCHLFILCEKHNNREAVEQLYKAPEEIWSS